jgi:hypothetical protein
MEWDRQALNYPLNSEFCPLTTDKDVCLSSTEEGTAPQFQSGMGKGHEANQSPEGEPEDEYSQAAVIYDDPDQIERQKLIEQLQHGAERSMGFMDQDLTRKIQSTGVASALVTVPKKRVASEYRVLMSAIDAPAKAELSKIVKGLGGTVLEARFWDKECTHLVVGDVSRNEKFLAACAAGKWVLRPSFVRDSHAANGFVDEGEHEYCGDHVAQSSQKLALRRLAAAPKRWRTMLGSNRDAVGAFDGWRVLLLCGKATKRDGLHRLLRAGGAEILPSDEPSPAVAQQATHLFVESEKEHAQAKELAAALSGVVPLKADYIAEYLSSEQMPPIKDYAISDLDGSGQPRAKRRRHSHEK